MAAASATSSPEAFLARYAQELELLASGLESLQLTLAEKNMRGGAMAPVGQQALDELTQRAQALAGIARRLPPIATLDMASVSMLTASVTLADVAARLLGETPPGMDVVSGEVELF